MLANCPLNRTVPCRRIDLVVERKQVARGELRQLCSIKDIDDECFAVQDLVVHLVEIIFRHIEDNTDRLQLRDNDERVGTTGEDDVTRDR